VALAGGTIELDHLPAALRATEDTATLPAEDDVEDDNARPLSKAELQRRSELEKLLAEHGGNIRAVARVLGKSARAGPALDEAVRSTRQVSVERPRTATAMSRRQPSPLRDDDQAVVEQFRERPTASTTWR
jgi:hypothetical protein